GCVARALGLVERLPDGERVASHLGLLKHVGLLRRAMGDVRGSIDDFTARASYAREHGRGDEEVRALLELGGALSWVDRERGLAAVEQALALAPGLHDQALRAHVNGSDAFLRILVHGWRNEDAETCRLSLDIVRRTGERRHLSLHVGRYALLQSHRSAYRAACRTAEQGLRLAVEGHDPHHHMTAPFYQSWA